jgi:hypothetical protein
MIGAAYTATNARIKGVMVEKPRKTATSRAVFAEDEARLQERRFAQCQSARNTSALSTTTQPALPKIAAVDGPRAGKYPRQQRSLGSYSRAPLEEPVIVRGRQLLVDQEVVAGSSSAYQQLITKQALTSSNLGKLGCPG